MVTTNKTIVSFALISPGIRGAVELADEVIFFAGVVLPEGATVYIVSGIVMVTAGQSLVAMEMNIIL